MDPITIVAAAVASAIANTLATTGWERLKSLLLRSADEAGGSTLETCLRQELDLEERHMQAVTDSPEVRQEIRQLWAERIASLVTGYPELLMALTANLPGELDLPTKSIVFQRNHARGRSTIIAPANGDVNFRNIPRS